LASKTGWVVSGYIFGMRMRKRSKSPCRGQDSLLKGDVQKLFMRRNVPDNFVDERYFLKRMYIQETEKKTFGRLVLDTVIVQQQVLLVVGVFVSFRLHMNFHGTALASLGMLIVTLAGAWSMLAPLWSIKLLESNIGELWVGLLLVVMFCPLLQTLTKSFASDTVQLLVMLSALIHLLFYDYGTAKNPVSPRLDCAFSLNAGFVMSLLLASRLKEVEQVASFLLSSIFLLVIFPSLLIEIRRENKSQRVEQAIALLNFIGFLFLRKMLHMIDGEGSSFAQVHAVFAIFVSIICPILLLQIHRFKNVIRGPWDLIHVKQIE